MFKNKILTLLLICCASACTPTGQSSHSSAITSSNRDFAPAPLVVDDCEDFDYAEERWLQKTSDHFVFHYFRGTAADRDIDEIIFSREQAYQSIHSLLGIHEKPVIDVFLSPNRLAAREHGLGVGTAYPAENRYEVVYTGVPGSFENTQYGHELTHVLAYRIDPEHAYHLEILDEGLAEYLDQSRRNLHTAYAQKLTAGYESRTHVSSLDRWDVWGDNYGRAGSLVAYLIETYGMDAFLDLWRGAHVEWQSGCWNFHEYGCVSTAQDLENVLDVVLRNRIDSSWIEVQAGWDAAVRKELEKGPCFLDFEDVSSVHALFEVMDLAIRIDDPLMYRSTMEGFYCDWEGDSGRWSIADRAVRAYAYTSSEVVAIYPIGTKNFPSALALVLRTDERGASSFLEVYLERVEVGWRVAWSDDWQ